MNGTGGTAAGSATVFLGAAGQVFDDNADGTIVGERAGDAVGWPVATAGDVNADGFSDIVLGATESGPGGSLFGHAEIYFGGPGSEFDIVMDGKVSGASAGQLFGIGVGSAGDVNDDGFADVIIGATPLVGTTSPGSVYIYWGAPAHPFDDTYDDHLIGEAGGDRFGATVF
jgi:hypothetical protein